MKNLTPYTIPVIIALAALLVSLEIGTPMLHTVILFALGFFSGATFMTAEHDNKKKVIDKVNKHMYTR